MIFSMRKDDFESEKERNLYYKFFAGYFFNELVKDFEARLRAFCALLNSCSRGGKDISQTSITLTPGGTHVSFDNHEHRFGDPNADRGEFADILVHDRSTLVVVPIEAKVHSDWSYDKDVRSNEDRLHRIEKEMPSARFFPCLLLTRNKWEACTKQQSSEYSNYRQLTETGNCRTRVILWEELLALVDNPKVVEYVKGQLDRPVYGFDGGWFARRDRPPREDSAERV